MLFLKLFLKLECVYNDMYKVIKIDPDDVLDKEALGSKEKFWYRAPTDNPEVQQPDWLFKIPDENTGQHWSEKVAEQVAVKLGVLRAKVELADFNGILGSSTESFARGGRTLFHGNQILAGAVFEYNPEKQFRQSGHTLENIFLALEYVFISENAGILAKRQFAEYLVLDAIIGNTDRHHENWGVLRKQVGDGFKGSLAPTFDHASSLGRELLDEGGKISRKKILDEKSVGNYSNKGRGAIYWSESDPCGLSPLELVKRSCDAHGEIFKIAMDKIKNLEYNILKDIINQIPQEFISELAKNLALQLMCYNISELKKVRI